MFRREPQTANLSMEPPANPKIYHIVHVDRLASVVKDDCLWCDSQMQSLQKYGTNIGMPEIKKRRLENRLNSHSGLHVGDCVPFYFCPRSVMLYLIYKANRQELDYRGGQGPIVHLEADLHETVDWARQNDRQWAFTLSNAGSIYFEDCNDLSRLDEIDWNAVNARDWRGCKEGKQAEFLVEKSFPWILVQHIGVYTMEVYKRSLEAMEDSDHHPTLDIKNEWYY